MVLSSTVNYDRYVGLSREELYNVLKSFAKSIRDEYIRHVVLDLLENPMITFTKVEPKISILESPAAPVKHHAYPGGLIDHTISVVELAISISKTFEKVYNISSNLDLIIGASILHDLFKYYQYEPDPVTGGVRPRSDWYLSHEFSMIAELTKRGAPDDLIRVIAETHGAISFSKIEGQIVHLADSIDSQFASQIQDIIWRACVDIEIQSDGKYNAKKIFNKLMRIKNLFELAKTYYKDGREMLKKCIVESLNLDITV